MTGVSSYLAQTIVPLLEKDDEIVEIIGADIKPPPQEFKKVRFIKRDIRDPKLAEDFKGADVLIHLAFIVMPIRDMAETNSINIQGSINAFESAAKAGIKKIVQASSVAAYGSWPENPDVITEDIPVKGMPGFYYSWTKAEVEEYIDGFQQKHPDIMITRLRPCIFVGPKINNAIKKLATQKIFVKFSGVKSNFQLAWDEDVAQAFYLAAKGSFHGAFNIAGDNPIDVNDLGPILGLPTIKLPFSMVKALAKVAWSLRFIDFISPEWLDVMRYPVVVDCQKAKQVLGWKPKYDTTGALKKLMEYKEELAENQ